MNEIQLQVPDDVIETVHGQVDADGETAEDMDLEDEGQDTTEGSEEGPTWETAKKPGIDQVLKDIEGQFGSGHAEVIRGLQKNFSQHGEVEARLRQLNTSIQEVEDLKQRLQSPEEEGPNPLDDVPPEQLELLRNVLEEEGYVRKDELDEQDKLVMMEESNLEGVEKFGESFGEVDPATGEFILSQDAQESMAPTYDRVKTEDGMTFSDLYILTNFNKLVESAYKQGAESSVERLRAENGERVSRAKRGNVTNRNAGGLTRTPIYDPEEVKDMSVKGKLDSVMSNAFKALSSQ